MSSRGAVEGELSVDDALAALPRVLDVLASAPWWQPSDAELAAATPRTATPPDAAARCSLQPRGSGM